jgi:dienelactone hydrolase
MSEVVLFHHVQGLTDGVLDFAEQLRSGGHTVHVPDLFGARPAATLQEGFALMQGIGDEVLRRRVEEAVSALPASLVYAGMSWGVSAAQRLTQTRAGAKGALLYEACIPVTGEWAFGPWPEAAAVQIHGMDADEFFALEGDLDAARELVAALGPERGEVFTYPGDRHLFTDSSLPSYDAEATALVLQRSRDFLDRVG